MTYLDTPDIDYDIVAEPQQRLAVNKDLNMARQIAENTGANLFLTGKAGTGKTTFLHNLRKTSGKRIVVLAPTGVAAINANGSTIHSFFQLSFSPFIPGVGFAEDKNKYLRFAESKKKIIRSLDLLVIDEISMVRGDTLDAIDQVLRRYRDPMKPFGGVQLLLIGDLRQLSPVVKDHEWNLLSKYYNSPYFFESHALKQAGMITLELTTVYRQNDLDFVEILNAVRDNRADDEILQRLNQRYLPGFNPTDEEGYIRLTTHNRFADDYNYGRLHLLPGSSAHYQAKITGTFPESSFPADLNLQLKVGAQVMFIKNDVGEFRRFYNGMIARVESLDSESVIVRPLDGSEPITVTPMEWENTHYTIESDGSVSQNIDGVFAQLPLRLAWAITIHKSQGLTFDKAIIDASRSFAPGQAYVALSRCRTLEGMALTSPLCRSAIITDNLVSGFIDEQNRRRPDEAQIRQLAMSYFSQILSEVFDFSQLKRDFAELTRCVTEFLDPIEPGYYQKYKEMEKNLINNVVNVGEKFDRMYAHCSYNPEDIDRHLLDKIKSGCGYFIKYLLEIGNLVNHTPLVLDNKQYTKRLTTAAQHVMDDIRLKSGILGGLQEEDFTPAVYLNLKARTLVRLDAAPRPAGAVKAKEKSRKNNTYGYTSYDPASKSSKPKREKAEKEKKPKKPKGYSKIESLKLFESGKTLAAIAETRGLALSTICGHLADCVAEGRLERERLVSDSDLEKVKEIMRRGESQQREPKDVRGEAAIATSKIAVSVYMALERANAID